MTKQEFMEELKSALKDESYATVSQAIIYYDEMIDDLIEEGLSEQDAIMQLDSINTIALQLKYEDQVIEVKPIKKSVSVTVGVLLFLGFPLWGSLVAAGLCLVLSFYILLWCAPIVSVALGIAGIINFIVGIFGAFALMGTSLPLILTQLGATALFGALGLIGVYSTYLVSARILQYTKECNKMIKDYSVDLLRKVGLIC